MKLCFRPCLNIWKEDLCTSPFKYTLDQKSIALMDLKSKCLGRVMKKRPREPKIMQIRVMSSARVGGFSNREFERS